MGLMVVPVFEESGNFRKALHFAVVENGGWFWSELLAEKFCQTISKAAIGDQSRTQRITAAQQERIYWIVASLVYYGRTGDGFNGVRIKTAVEYYLLNHAVNSTSARPLIAALGKGGNCEGLVRPDGLKKALEILAQPCR